MDNVFEDLRKKLEERFDYWNQDIKDDDVMDFSKYDLAKEIAEYKTFKLYRYLPANYFNIRNIENQAIHLSSNGVLNDIYEGVPCLDDYDSDYYYLNQLKDMACMTCFSESNCNTLMWSHYAHQHEGICIEYDFGNLKDEQYQVINHLFPVLYSKKRYISKNIKSIADCHNVLNSAIEGGYVYDGEEPLDDILPLFLSKGMDWSYEKEWRIVYTKKQLYDLDIRELYEGNIKIKCISAIYLGYRIHPEIRKNILEIVQRLQADGQKVDVYESQLDKDGYNIIFKKIN